MNPANSFLFFLPFRVTSTAYGGSQARGLIGAAAAGLCQSHSNSGSEPPLQTYNCWGVCHSHKHHQIQAASATYTAAQGDATRS